MLRFVLVTALVIGLLAGAAACRQVDGVRDALVTCEQSIEGYCATDSVGCPSSSGRRDVCAWRAERSIQHMRWGDAVSCELPLSDGFTLHTDGGANTFLFDDEGLVMVLEDGHSGVERGRCLAGRLPHMNLGARLSWPTAGSCPGEDGGRRPAVSSDSDR